MLICGSNEDDQPSNFMRLTVPQHRSDIKIQKIVIEDKEIQEVKE